MDQNGRVRVISVLETLAPSEVCSETYIVINSFDSDVEAENCYNYIKTKLVRFLILQASSSIMITKNSFMFVPIQDFGKLWTDEELYKKYGLTQEEIDYIESTIKPME